MLAILHANIVLKDRILPDAVLLAEGDRVASFGRDLPVPEGAEILDAGGLYLAPGFVDIHTHSDGVHWFHLEPEIASANLLRHGVTSVLPALYFNLDQKGYLEAVARINDARKKGLAPNIAGFYMEGPYLNPKYGCDREKNAWTGPIRREDYLPILEAAGEDAKVWCFAPEREGVASFVEDVCRASNDPRFAVAHSEAVPEMIEPYIPKGLCLATHHTNATGSIPRYSECRGVGVDETVWMNDGIYAELICDSRGIHVNPYLLRLILKIKGRDRIVLISDSFVANGPVPPGFEGVEDINFDFAGEIAGTKMTLDIAARNMKKHVNATIPEIFRYAAANPAAAAGLKDVGEIRPGACADLVLCDEEINVKKTILKGSVLA